jgi:branched-chain amino acid transport system substrate-binding protein
MRLSHTLFTAASFAALTSTAFAQAQPPLKVGLMLPATGTFAALGDMLERGFKLHVE